MSEVPTLPTTFTAVFVKESDGGYSCYAEDCPGANSQGETLEEARENLKDAISEVLQARNALFRDHARPKGMVREKMIVNVPL